MTTLNLEILSCFFYFYYQNIKSAGIEVENLFNI